MSEHQRVPDQLPMSEPTRGIDLGWVKHMMEEEYNARDWREANELALLALMEIQSTSATARRRPPRWWPTTWGSSCSGSTRS